jgi:hypothetical protein
MQANIRVGPFLVVGGMLLPCVAGEPAFGGASAALVGRRRADDQSGLVLLS